MQVKDYIIIGLVAILVIVAVWQMFRNRGGCRGCEGCQYRDECNSRQKDKDKK